MQILWIVLALIAITGTIFVAGAAAATYLLAAELRLFLRAPSFYVRKMFGPPPPDKRAHQIVGRIQDLLPAKTVYAKELGDKVARTPKTIQELVAARDRITLYLEYDVYGDGLGDSVSREDPTAVRALETRRAELDARIEKALGQLKRIENRVAAHVLATRDEATEDAVQQELGETLEDLDTLLDVSRAQGLLSE
jgi:hypothetical protein